MDRYRYTKIKGNKYLTTMLPDIQKKNTDVIREVMYGDRLDILAEQYYGDSTLWWIIAKANALSGDSYFINTNQEIRIPIDYIEILKKLKG